eukprot:COSAG02_NODE_1090_length_14647_cov_122.569425_7_plen_70_part_00
MHWTVRPVCQITMLRRWNGVVPHRLIDFNHLFERAQRLETSMCKIPLKFGQRASTVRVGQHLQLACTRH